MKMNYCELQDIEYKETICATCEEPTCAQCIVAQVFGIMRESNLAKELETLQELKNKND